MNKWQIESAREYMKLAKKEVASLKASFERLESLLYEDKPDLYDFNYWYYNTRAWLEQIDKKLRDAQEKLNEKGGSNND